MEHRGPSPTLARRRRLRSERTLAAIEIFAVQGSPGRRTMGERDLTAREEFIGLCLAAAAIVVLFVFIVSYS